MQSLLCVAGCQQLLMHCLAHETSDPASVQTTSSSLSSSQRSVAPHSSAQHPASGPLSSTRGRPASRCRQVGMRRAERGPRSSSRVVAIALCASLPWSRDCHFARGVVQCVALVLRPCVSYSGFMRRIPQPLICLLRQQRHLIGYGDHAARVAVSECGEKHSAACLSVSERRENPSDQEA